MNLSPSIAKTLIIQDTKTLGLGFLASWLLGDIIGGDTFC